MCVGCSSPFCGQISDKINLRRREFVWLTVQRHTVHRGGEGTGQACEVTVVMVSIAKKQREVNLVLSFSIQSVPQVTLRGVSLCDF